MTPADEVVRVLDCLGQRGLSVWLDGGWGVDALAGEQTRPHEDLDLAILLAEADRVTAVIMALGYRVADDEMPTRLDLRDQRDYRIDLHPITLDDQGNGRQQLQDGTFGTYTREGLTGTGVISGRPVRCLSAALQLRFHQGYELDDADRHDIELLRRLVRQPADRS
jgi:lincosamide nucleotidyltransferase A/C/D/E